MSGSARVGFTLVEVMVALVIGGMTIASAGALLGGLSDRAEFIATTAAHADAGANAEYVLRSLTENLDSGSGTTPPLVGSADSVVFRSWCQTPRGWFEQCAVRLSFDRRPGVAVLGMELRGSTSTLLSLPRGAGRFHYLDDTGQSLRWIDSWSERELPVAVGIILDGDTLLLPVPNND
jgi:prepilin-type N-terminal cleavage/methylation domain-containing protein